MAGLLTWGARGRCPDEVPKLSIPAIQHRDDRSSLQRSDMAGWFESPGLDIYLDNLTLGCRPLVPRRQQGPSRTSITATKWPENSNTRWYLSLEPPVELGTLYRICLLVCWIIHRAKTRIVRLTDPTQTRNSAEISIPWCISRPMRHQHRCPHHHSLRNPGCAASHAKGRRRIRVRRQVVHICHCEQVRQTGPRVQLRGHQSHQYSFCRDDS